MDKHIECTPGFHRSDAAWYAPAAGIVRPQIMVGLYADDGSGSGELSLDCEGYGFAVHVYNDSWSLFTRPEFAGLWVWLAEMDGQNVTASLVVDKLVCLGFSDLTQYEEPER